MLRHQYSRQIARLYRSFGKRIIPILVSWVIREQKQRAFAEDLDTWLEFETTREITNPSRRVIERNIRQSYRKGKNKAIKELAFYEISSGMTPLDWEALEYLQDINFNRIKDCTMIMQKAITYSCSKGVMEGWGTTKIAYELRKHVKGNKNMGIKRAKTITRTEIINSYNLAKQKQYQDVGIRKYEWLTAFDERTCDICAGYDGQRFIVGKGVLPPAHPNCRCSTLPVIPERK